MAQAANVVKFKRSAVAGKVPATTDLALGELALNTYDGRIYLKKSVSAVETVVALQPFPTGGTSGQVLTLDAGGNLIWVTSSATSSGTVTNTSIVNANGFTGTVATSTTTPAITLKTTVTGLLKGNGTTGEVTAATAGTDYLISSSLTGYATETYVGTAISNAASVRYDVSQSLTNNQQIQARANIDAISTGDAFLYSLIF
jgi:hypothetical protein